MKRRRQATFFEDQEAPLDAVECARAGREGPANVRTTAEAWAQSYTQWMHGGTFGSALHVETGHGGVAWAFCLSAPPHFETEHTPDHIAEPHGLKAQLRQVIQDALFREGARF